LAIYDHDGVLFKMRRGPREEDKEPRVDVLAVRTGKDYLLVVVNAKDESLWRYNGDRGDFGTGEQRMQLQRWSEGSEVRAAAGTSVRSSARSSGTEVPRPHEFGDT
jgi:hypothetical protein